MIHNYRFCYRTQCINAIESTREWHKFVESLQVRPVGYYGKRRNKNECSDVKGGKPRIFFGELFSLEKLNN